MLDEMQKTISMAELAKNAERIARDIETAGTVAFIAPTTFESRARGASPLALGGHAAAAARAR